MLVDELCAQAEREMVVPGGRPGLPRGIARAATIRPNLLQDDLGPHTVI